MVWRLVGSGRCTCQIVRTGRRIAYRLLGWNPWQEVLLRGVDALRHSIAPTRGPVMRC